MNRCLTCGLRYDDPRCSHVAVTDDAIVVTIRPCMPSLDEPCGEPCHRCAITDHEFRSVIDHPDDDECTFGGLAFYCGATRMRHHQPPRLPLTELDESPTCVTCRGDETVPLVGAPGGQFDPCPDCAVRGIPAVE